MRLPYISCLIAGAAAALMLGGFAADQKADTNSDNTRLAPQQCVNGGNSMTRRVIDKQTVLIEDGGRAALLTLTSPCSNLDELDKIGFEFNGSTQICDRRDVKILYSRFTERPVHCLVSKITPLTPEQAKAY